MIDSHFHCLTGMLTMTTSLKKLGGNMFVSRGKMAQETGSYTSMEKVSKVALAFSRAW